MWCLEVIKQRNDAFAAGLNANDINFLAENQITPFSRKMDRQTEYKIQLYKGIVETKEEDA